MFVSSSDSGVNSHVWRDALIGRCFQNVVRRASVADPCKLGVEIRTSPFLFSLPMQVVVMAHRAPGAVFTNVRRMVPQCDEF